MAAKPLNSHKIFLIPLLILSFFLIILVFSFRPSPAQFNDIDRPLPSDNRMMINLIDDHADIKTHHPVWYDLLKDKITNRRKMKVALVNLNDDVKGKYWVDESLAETVSIEFQPVSKKLKWENLFPEWIDEEHKWGPPRCPEIPMPRMDDRRYRGIDVVVAKLPCGTTSSEIGGVRDVVRLQINLVVAYLVAESGLIDNKYDSGDGDGDGHDEIDQTVYVVFVGSCGPMQEIFRCDDRVMHVGDYWVYKPEKRRLKENVVMPVGSCQIAPPLTLTQTGGEDRRVRRSTSPEAKVNNTGNRRREAYVSILHSSESYVCGAIALAQSIIRSNSTRDLVLLHDSFLTADSIRALQLAGWKTRQVHRIRNPFAKKGTYNEWNYSKLRVWQLVEYERVIFIDADLLVLRNIDHLFSYPQLSAAANDRVIFNSGLMLVEPSACAFEEMMGKSFKVKSYNGGDQGFLNEVFTWWHRWPAKVNKLKIFKRENSKREIDDGVYALHYLGWKPWMCYRDYDCNWDMKVRQAFASDSAHKKWWEVYDLLPTELQRFCGLRKTTVTRITRWKEQAKNASYSDRHWAIKLEDPRQYQLVQ